MMGTGLPPRRRHLPNDLRNEDGYATLTAVMLCMAVSLLCVGVMTLVTSERAAERHRLRRVQQDELIHTAVMQFTGEVLASTDPYRVSGNKSVSANGQTLNVQLSAQSEAAKWPLSKIDAVSSDVLKNVTRLTVEQLEALAKSDPHPRNDCVRSLFSELGVADPGRDLPRATLYGSAAKDGQIWRIRAVAAGRVEERRVRFTGQAAKPIAVLSFEQFGLGEMPSCTDLIHMS